MFRKAEILSRIELRQSTIKDWLSCPLMFRYRHVLKLDPSYRSLAAIHGSTLHLCIHRLHSEGLNQDIQSLYTTALREIIDLESHIPIRWKSNKLQDIAALKLHGLELLEGYVGNRENHSCNLLFSEVRFRLRVNGLELTGTMDQVRQNPDGSIELVDLKSGMQRPFKRALQRDWQLNLYAYALRYGEILKQGEWVRIRLKPDRTSIYFLRAHEIYKRGGKYGKKGSQKGQPLISCEKPSWQLRQFRLELENIIKMMTKDWPFPNTASCGFCAFHDHCDDRLMMNMTNKYAGVRHIISHHENQILVKGEL
jgi:RecB family exonuclease